ncbi:MAG: hypothetical protein GYB42_13565 [Alphaproteobacteria bacterium]|jgi:hypothetical protein|nr:hypothetical protein [Alphaproteobacteria bacterium]
MNLQRSAGLGLGLLGSFLMWQTGIGLAHFFYADGAERLLSLLVDPSHSMRLLSAMSAFLAGLAALTEREGGAWLAGFSTALLGLQTLALLGGHGSVVSWQQEAVFLIISTSLFLTLVVARGQAAAETKVPETDAASTVLA